jgi:predicted extracellular nuclease
MKKHLLSFALFVSGGIGLLHAQAPLFFSEYAEGSSNNKYLEIYNPTDSTVSLSGYTFPSVSNGSDGNYEFWNTFDEGAVITSQGVYIIAHPSADSIILSQANQTHSYLSNGDDGYGLAFGSESAFTMLDVIGDFGDDPGSAWDVAGVSNATKDHTLVRKYSFSNGNVDWSSSAGTTTEDSEWIVFDINEWMYLGTHEDLSTSIVFGCTDSMATNYCVDCNTDDGSCIYPELNLTIAEIQGMIDSSPYEGSVVTTTGLVVAKSESSYFLQDSIGAWNGIYVYDTNDSLVVGNRISITAIVAEYYGATQLNSVSNLSVLSSEFTNSPATVNAELANTEAYEGVLVTIDTLQCFTEANSFGESELFDSLDTLVTDDLFYEFTPTVGSYYQVTGVIHYSYGNYKVNPRSASDIVEYIVGCMDSTSFMYNPEATLEFENSCDDIVVVIAGCTDPMAINYCSECNADDGTCMYSSLELTISEIQGMTDSSPFIGQVITTSGVVTAVAPSGYFIQDNVATWSGIYVYDVINNPLIGDEITIEAEVDEFYDMTELKNVSSFEVSSSGDSVEPLSFIPLPITEEYEGCLITLAGECTSINNEFGEAEFMSGFEEESFKTSDLIFLYDFEEGPYVITGVVEYSFGEYKLCPLDDVSTSPIFDVADLNSVNTEIFMSHNVLNIKCSIIGEQTFELFNILGERIISGVLDQEISIPLHYIETATYIIKVGNFSQLIVKQ